MSTTTARLVAEPDLITLAACGDLAAQRRLTELAMDAFAEGRATFWEAFAWAMSFGSLAMAHGNLTDKGRMVVLLNYGAQVAQEAGDTARQCSYEAQALTLVREAIPQAIAEGCPDVDAMLADYERLIADVSPEGLARVEAIEAQRQAPTHLHSLH